jgi:hypothetical protein
MLYNSLLVTKMILHYNTNASDQSPGYFFYCIKGRNKNKLRTINF